VIIGVNGAGKSTVLDTIAMQLCLFASLVTGDSADLEPDERDIQNGREQASLRMMMRAGDGEQLWELRGTRADGFESTGKEQEEQAVALREGLSRDPKAGVPVLCFYPATRAFTGGTSPKGRGPSDARLEVYAHAFSRQLGPFQDFAHWFRSEEDAENEGRVRIRPDYRNPRLVVLRRALERFLSDLGESHFSNLRMERLDATASPRARASIGRLVLDMDGQPLGIDQFSEGQRNTLLLVADLARRLAIANPGLEDPLQGEGIVLIDEIDLHLHPSWQRGIVPALCATFPGCQFIVSTHSPQVLSRIQRKNVFILEGFDLVDVTPHTYGRDANSILAEVMGLSERPRDIEEKIREASRLVDEERLDEAKVALHELTAILGDDDNMVVRLRTLASFLEDRS
jgi:predicted ATP-binding protein involved in virulence